MDEGYANKTWQTLHNAIHQIHKQNASGLSFEELYRNAYNMVLHKFGDKLYNGLVETITLHLRSVAAEIQLVPDEAFLGTLKDMWDKHRLSSIMIRDILMYMVCHSSACSPLQSKYPHQHSLPRPPGSHLRGSAEEDGCV